MANERFVIFDNQHAGYLLPSGHFGTKRNAMQFSWPSVQRLVFNRYASDPTRYRWERIHKLKQQKQPSPITLWRREFLEPHREPLPKQHLNTLSPAILAYVPPAARFNPEVFVANLRKFKTTYPIVLFSDDWPDTFKLRLNPDRFREQSGLTPDQQRWVVNNVLFFTAIQIADRMKHTHIIYVEADSRVGCDHWDEKIFDEFFAAPGALIGGSMVVYNPCNAGMKAAQRWHSACAHNTRRNFPIATYGFKGAADGSGSCVFVNGSLGVYDVQRMAEFFDMSNAHKLAVSSTAWDMEIGKRLWAKYGVDAYDYVVHLNSIYSSYGDVLTSEADRMKMLLDGDRCAVHQVKSAATI